MNTDKLMQLKQNFTSQKFQWIKTDDPNLIGKVVKCKDVVYASNSFYAVFEDGSRINIKLLNSSLMMLHGDQKPLSIDEVKSINPPRKIENKPKNVETILTQPNKIIPESVNTQPQKNNQSQTNSIQSFSIFENWKHEQSSITLKLDIELPNKKLLKMMYLNAENKDEFLDQLSQYLEQKINKTVLKQSVKKILAVTPKKTNTEITIKEV